MPKQQLEQLWSEVQTNLTRLVPENVYRIWLERLRPIARDEHTLYLQAPDQVLDWVRRRYTATLISALQAADPLLKSVELRGAGDETAVANEEQPISPSPESRASRAAPRRLNPAKTFGDFVIGSGNRFAHAAALAAAELPGHAYNPLFIHGTPGTGKTHLLQAIANYVATHDPRLDVHYETAETFATEFRSALQSSSITEFKRARRRADVLLLDDVHFLNHKKRSTEEFLFTIDSLVESGSQVVLSGDDAPDGMPFLGESLQERLQGGLVAELDLPDRATRVAILRKRAPQLQDHPAHAEVLDYLADRVTTNARALEGALIRVHAYASLTQRSLTVELAEQVLARLDRDGSAGEQTLRTPSVSHIQKHTSRQLGLPKDELQSSKRNRQVVYARQVAMYLCRELTALSLPAISAEFGGRDHTTVLHAHRKIKQRVLTDPDTRVLVERIQREIG